MARFRKLEFSLRRLPSWLILGLSWTVLALVAWSDHVSGLDLQLEFFYLPPLAVVAWICGRRDGIITAALATVLWTLVDVTGRPIRTQPGLIVWNAAVAMLFFSGVALLVSFMARWTSRCGGKLHGRLRTSTSTASSRSMIVSVTTWVTRCSVLMPETDPAQAESAVRKLQSLLESAMAEGRWPVTFSIGVMTFLSAPASPDAALAVADARMYEVKHGRKAGASFGVWNGLSP